MNRSSLTVLAEKISLLISNINRFKKTVLFVMIGYLVLSTFIWHALWGTLIGLVYEVTQLGANEDPVYFRRYAVKQPVLNALCDFGNLVIDVFQPMVSDAALIKHWEKNREGMERMALMVVQKQIDPMDISNTQSLKTLKDAGILRIFASEYGVVFETFPELGREKQIYFCGRPRYTKNLSYYTGDYVPIEIDGRLLARPISEKKEEALDEGKKGAILVGNADFISAYRNEAMVRRLSNRWYIWR